MLSLTAFAHSGRCLLEFVPTSQRKEKPSAPTSSQSLMQHLSEFEQSLVGMSEPGRHYLFSIAAKYQKTLQSYCTFETEEGNKRRKNALNVLREALIQMFDSENDFR